jgi:hypothetical protein
MFERTDTGYRATDETIKWWESRDTCPDPQCGTVVEPDYVDGDGFFQYHCPIDVDITWSRKKGAA